MSYFSSAPPYGNPGVVYDSCSGGCPADYPVLNTDPNGDQCCTQSGSPIVIDTAGTGFDLTSVQDGVEFDFFGTGRKIHISWTARGSENAWLVLDRNGNGMIDSALEMFGNLTDQRSSSTPNGFAALAVFDQVAKGGNADGIIDSKDAIYNKLRLWVDTNHNGVSEHNERIHHINTSEARMAKTQSKL